MLLQHFDITFLAGLSLTKKPRVILRIRLGRNSQPHGIEIIRNYKAVGSEHDRHKFGHAVDTGR